MPTGPTPTTTTPATEPPVTPPIPGKPNKLLIVLIVLSLLLLGTTGYLAYQNYQLRQQLAQVQTQPSPSPTSVPTSSPSPTPDPTADWETYRNEEYRFSFKYDPSGILTVTNGVLEPLLVRIAYGETQFEWFVKENTENLSLEDFIKRHAGPYPGYNSGDRPSSIEKDVKLGNVTGILIEFPTALREPFEFDGPSQHFYIKRDDQYVYWLRFYSSDEELTSADRDFFRNIITSAQLTN